MIAQNTFFIMVERDAYWTRDSIVLLNLVSKHPRNAEMKHRISIEQLLVDVVAEKNLGCYTVRTRYIVFMKLRIDYKQLIMHYLSILCLTMQLNYYL